MDADVNVTDVRDWTKVEQGGAMRDQKRAVFYIGRYGPFVEYFDKAEYSLSALEARVAVLKANLPAQS